MESNNLTATLSDAEIKKASYYTKTIDWEQRRYEMARDFVSAVIASGNAYPNLITSAIKTADELIEQLKSST